MIQALESFISYRNPEALRRFKFQYQPYAEEAELIFEDVLRYLWLTATLNERRKTNPETPDLTIWGGMVVIDEMWHCFILVTEQYTDFCMKQFGTYIHHPPALHKFDHNLKEFGEEKANELLVGELIPEVYDLLGEEVAIRWFDSYQKYNQMRNMH